MSARETFPRSLGLLQRRSDVGRGGWLPGEQYIIPPLRPTCGFYSLETNSSSEVFLNSAHPLLHILLSELFVLQLCRLDFFGICSFSALYR